MRNATSSTPTLDYDFKQVQAGPKEGFMFEAGKPKTFGFTGPDAPNTGLRFSCSDNPNTVGKSSGLTIAVYAEGTPTPIQTATISMHEGNHGAHFEVSTTPGRRYTFVITASHAIGFAINPHAVKPAAVRPSGR